MFSASIIEEMSSVGSTLTSGRRKYLEGALGLPFTHGNRVVTLNNGDEIFPAMLRAIRQSTRHIELLTFIYWSGPIAEEFAEALSSRAQADLDVRVILDAFGCSAMDNGLVDKMKHAGVLVQWFRPLRSSFKRYDWRTHRKVLVCDDTVAFTGGVGIAEEWEGSARNPGEWRDMHFQIEGPAVASLSGAFWDNWIEEIREPPQLDVQFNESQDGETALQVVRSNSTHRITEAFKILQALIALAEKRLDIICPYFVPPETLLEMICEKARSGVAVRIIIPGQYTDKRFERWEAARYFGPLLESGAEIFLYQPTMIHTKLILCDDDLALIGSINFNRRSLQKDEEIGVVISDLDYITELTATFESDLGNAKRLDPHQWSGPNPFEAFVHQLITPFRSQL